MNKKYVYFMGIFIAVLMIGSVLGLYQGGKSKVTIGDNVFYDVGGSWMTRAGDKQIYFSNHPLDLQKLDFNANVDLNVEKVYLVMDSEFEESRQRFKDIIHYFNSVRIVDACFDDCDNDYPIVSCSVPYPVFYVKNGTTTSGVMEGNCVVMQAVDTLELDKLTERLIFKLVGI